jgi:hypothetical protein
MLKFINFPGPSFKQKKLTVMDDNPFLIPTVLLRFPSLSFVIMKLYLLKLGHWLIHVLPS